MQEHQVTVARKRYTARSAVLRARDAEPARDGGHVSRCPRRSSTGSCFKVMVPFPSEEDLIAIIDRTTGADAPRRASPVCTAAEIVEMQRLARARADRAARDRPTRSRVLAATHPDQPARAGARARVRALRRLAARRPGRSSPPARSCALLDGRFNVSIDDIRAVALPALRHRVILNFEGEAEGITTEAVVRSILDEVSPPAVE